MGERVIDAMIANVRSKARADRRQRQEELEARRTEVLRRIGQAAVDHGLPIAQSVEADETLRVRLQEAQQARISLAEAMADLAEFSGDFTSPLWWWDIQTDSGTSLWKGYVIDRRLCRIRFVADRSGTMDGIEVPYNEQVHLDINVRQACHGAFVASVYAGGSVAVGISEGDSASIEDAVVSAYVAFWKGVRKVHGMHREYVPKSLLDRLTVDSEEGNEVESETQSEETAQRSQRELEEKGD